MTRIIIDSASDFTQEEIKEFDLEALYVSVFDTDDVETILRDGLDIKRSDIYKAMRKGKIFKTSQINLNQYLEGFEKVCKEGEDFIYICLSYGLTTAWDTSRMAIKMLEEKYPQRRMVSINSKSMTIGEQIIVRDIIEKKNEGYSLDELEKRANEISGKVVHLFTVDDLNYLFMGGRISKTVKNVGQVLNIKPLLGDDDDGALALKDKVRGEAKIYKKLSNTFIEDAKKNPDVLKHAIVGHTDNIEGAQKLFDIISSEVDTKDVIIREIGPAIGAHLGPGAVAIAYLDETR